MNRQSVLHKVRWARSNQQRWRLHATPEENAPLPYDACDWTYVQHWLSRSDVRTAIHATTANMTQWRDCVDLDYPTPNTTKGVLHEYRELMDGTNWDILLYSGDADVVVNFIQTEKIVIGLRRQVLSPYTPWFYNGTLNLTTRQIGGWYVNYDRISWATVKGAGHLAPSILPAPMWQLVYSFLYTGRPGMPPSLAFPSHARTSRGKSKQDAILPLLLGVFVGLTISGVGLVVFFWATKKKPKPASPYVEHTPFAPRPSDTF